MHHQCRCDRRPILTPLTPSSPCQFWRDPRLAQLHERTPGGLRDNDIPQGLWRPSFDLAQRCSDIPQETFASADCPAWEVELVHPADGLVQLVVPVAGTVDNPMNLQVQLRCRQPLPASAAKHEPPLTPHDQRSSRSTRTASTSPSVGPCCATAAPPTRRTSSSCRATRPRTSAIRS